MLVPMDTTDVKVARPIFMLGFHGVPDRASKGTFTNVRVPIPNTIFFLPRNENGKIQKGDLREAAKPLPPMAGANKAVKSVNINGERA
jgi:hypothetical protein